MDMKPYYEDDLVTIYNTDVLPWLPLMPTNAYDIILTDPPYNEVNGASAYHKDGSTWFSGDKGGADSLPVDATELAALFANIASQWCYVFCGWKQVSDFLVEFESQGLSIRMGGWQKASPVPMQAGRNWLTAFEALAIGRHPNADFNGHAESPVFYGEKEHKTIHPTQKPNWLMNRIIGATVERDADVTLFDPFMGSGSSIEAAKGHGIKAVGVEINEEYCERAANRLSQDTLF